MMALDSSWEDWDSSGPVVCLGCLVPLKSQGIHMGAPDCQDETRNYSGWQNDCIHLEILDLLPVLSK